MYRRGQVTKLYKANGIYKILTIIINFEHYYKTFTILKGNQMRTESEYNLTKPTYVVRKASQLMIQRDCGQC